MHAEHSPDDAQQHHADNPPATYDPTPDTTPHQRGHTDFDRRMQSERAAALKRTRARNQHGGGIPNMGNVKHGRHGNRTGHGGKKGGKG